MGRQKEKGMVAIITWVSTREKAWLQRMAEKELRSMTSMVRIAIAEAAHKRGIDGNGANAESSTHA